MVRAPQAHTLARITSAPSIRVASAADPRLADYVDLRSPERRRAIEGDELFIAEGINVVLRLVHSRFALRSILVTPKLLPRLDAARDRIDCPIYVAERDVLAAVAGFDLHRGAVAAADRGAPASLGDLLRTARTIALLEGLNDPENLGAIARSARGLGIDGLVLDPTCADAFYRRTVRVSMGEILFLPVVRAADWRGALDAVDAAGFRMLALTPAADAASIHLVTRTTDDRIAIMLGAEGPGLSASTLARAERVRIPMHADVDSLNVGHAAAVAFALLSPPRPTPATTG
jgi:tRNA G18 (ribose-2'-O)-methylase SpoU